MLRLAQALVAAALVPLAASLQSLQPRVHAPGFAVAVLRNGRIVERFAAGDADVARSLRVTPQTIFHIGSITKMFTATAVMQLVQSGKIDLHASVTRYLPQFVGWKKVTIAELLMHRSGLPNYLDAALATGRTATPTTPQAILTAMAAKSLDFAPGAHFEYSNTNYVALGLIVASISGESLAAYERRAIFIPAKMHATFVGAAPAGRPLALGYKARDTATIANPGDPSWYYACGDILSTVGDLARFDRALMNGTLLSPATFAEMAKVARPATGFGDAGYGYGVMTLAFGDRTLVGHHGGLPGFEADNEMIPRDGFAVIALGNAFDFATSGPENLVFEQYYPKQFAALVVAAHNASAKPVRDPNPALTRRFAAFLRGFLAGKQVDPHLTPQMAAALTPSAIAQNDGQLFARLGALRRLTFRDRFIGDGYHDYDYLATFADGYLNLRFVLDRNGALAGFFKR